MIVKTTELRLKLMNEGKRDEMKMIQPIGELKLNEGLIIQHVFMHKDEEMGEQSVEWCTRTVVKFSNGVNLQKPLSAGPKHCRKGGFSEVRWHGNADNGES